MLKQSVDRFKLFRKFQREVSGVDIKGSSSFLNITFKVTKKSFWCCSDKNDLFSPKRIVVLQTVSHFVSQQTSAMFAKFQNL